MNKLNIYKIFFNFVLLEIKISTCCHDKNFKSFHVMLLSTQSSQITALTMEGKTGVLSLNLRVQSPSLTWL